MAINIVFNGATIYKPGAYSKVEIDLGGGFPLSPTGLVAIFGEAEAGTPGANETNIANNVFSPEQLPLIREKYRSGPIVDACNFLFAPGADGAIPSGAQAVYIYKTNAAARAALALANSWGSVRALEWGLGGNKLTYKNSLVPATAATITSSAGIDLTADALAGNDLVLRVQGAASTLDNTFEVPVGTTTRALLLTALTDGANWSGGLPAGVSFSVGGLTDASALVTITRSTAGNPHREGFSRNFQLISGSLLGSGAGTINIAAGLVSSSSEDKAMITISNKRDLIDQSATVGGSVVLEIGRYGAGSVAPTVTINATQVLLQNNSATEYALNLSDYATIGQLVSFINTSTGGNWAADATTTLAGQLPSSVLDKVSNVGAEATSSSVLPVMIKKDAQDVRDMFAALAAVELIAGAGAVVGLPDAAAESYLTGGALGGTSTAEITNALSKFEKLRVNSVVPLFSRDAAADIADALTDGTSTYTIDGIHQAVKTHVSLMCTTKRKSERQAYLSYKASYEDCKEKSAQLAEARVQLMIQDVRQIDGAGVIKWFQPWGQACLVAGARAGSPVGTPMTFKYLNCSGIRQTGQAMSTPEQDIVMDFDADTMYDDAIQSGITFMEAPQSGGFRVVVDNTTYGRDGNWVRNRANVQYAADVLAYDFRNQLENIYVGVKNTVKATEIKSVCESILATYLAQGITVSTTDAPNGHKGLVVTLDGNTINVSVVVKLVEGIDFVLADITLQRAQSTA